MSEFFLKIKLAIITGSEVQGLMLGVTADHTWSLAKSLSNQKDEWRGGTKKRSDSVWASWKEMGCLCSEACLQEATEIFGVDEKSIKR